MSSLQTYIDPNSTNQLLNNLGLAIDEAKLVLNLSKLNNQVFNLESSNGVSEDSADLRKEITILEVQLNYVRDRARASLNCN
jgi:hypothetical protein